MKRVVEPEILDSLPFDDPEALRNRRDMRKLNHLMGNFRWFCACVSPQIRDGDHVVELGAGGGDLGRSLRRALDGKRAVTYLGLDLCPPPDDWPDDWLWQQEDVRTAQVLEEADVVLVNHLLHQFTEEELTVIGERIRARTRIFAACEPARRRRHLLQLDAARLLGISDVSLHDGRVSIRAGFKNTELASALGLDHGAGWEVRSRLTALGANRTLAERRL